MEFGWNESAKQLGLDVRTFFISQVVKGGSFIDIGGLFHVVYERISVAAQYGARELTLVDVEPPDCPWWEEMRARLSQKGISNCHFISSDVFDLEDKQYDVVHSSGVLYHLSNPIGYLDKLYRITRKHCIVTSTTLNKIICASDNVFHYTDASLVFVPGLKGEEKEALVQWYNEKRGLFGDITAVDDIALQLRGYKNTENYYPNWFIPTVPAFKAMCQSRGFRIVDEGLVEPDCLSYCLLLEKPS
jgi:ubiquinone/menaquinone biosynthesis C-methylase UbiE